MMICFETGGDDVEGDAEAVAERLEVGGVCFIMDIIHAYVQGLYSEVGDVYFGSSCEKL